MPTFTSDDAKLVYEVSGRGPDIVLLHPFPLNHHFWAPVIEQLNSRYRVIVPDLRAHGDSELGNGPVAMRKLANDLASLCKQEQITRAYFVGVSIGGYLLFEFWRQFREHVAALVLANTRATTETSESKASRVALADKVLHEGTAAFIEDMLPKVLSPATCENRPDIVDAARQMMQRMSPQDVSGVQRGIAERPDSTSTLKTISVPTLMIAGEDDSVPLSEAELMRQNIPGSRLQIIPKAGHYAAMEKPAEFGFILRGFVDQLPRV